MFLSTVDFTSWMDFEKDPLTSVSMQGQSVITRFVASTAKGGEGLRNNMVVFFRPGACNQDDWISAVRPVIEKRIQK